MRLLSIIGYPIGHSLSPAIYNAAFAAMGIDARFEAWSTPPAELAAAVARLRSPEMLGMSVTVPHKEAVMPLLDDLDATAKAIGAVNCIVKDGERLVGYNTDKYGFLRSLREAGFEPAGKRVLILGAGGAAHAVASGLAESDAATITFAGRTPQRVAAAAARLRPSLEGPRPLAIAEIGWHDAAFAAACRAADLIVNCTPVGMRHTESEGESPLSREHLQPGVWVCDTVYTPPETALLRLAREAGARPLAGLDMLLYQAGECFRLWTGREAPLDIMRTAALTALGQPQK